jgi:transposase
MPLYKRFATVLRKLSRHARPQVQTQLQSNVYLTCNVVERFFNRIKHFRRVSTRYDRLADNYLVFASLASAFGLFVNM